MKPSLLDSNVLIYAANGNAESLREFVCSAGNAVSSITGIEVYGFSAGVMVGTAFSAGE
jgi:predicted nucleic acid-binding protein